MKILNTKNIDAHYIKGLINGLSGAGKTKLAHTLKGKTLIVSAESGLLSLKDYDIDFISIAHNDKGEVLQNPQDRLKRLSEVYSFLQLETIYDNVFVDSLTDISQVLVEALKLQFPDPKDSLKLWGENASRMRAIVKSFRDLPEYHVFFTCVSEIEKDENGRRYTGFQVSGKMAIELPQYFDEVFYLNVDADGKRHLITNKTDNILAKDRSNKLAPVEPADLGYIMDKILKGEK